MTPTASATSRGTCPTTDLANDLARGTDAGVFAKRRSSAIDNLEHLGQTCGPDDPLDRVRRSNEHDRVRTFRHA
jgi:hypothetical protein